MADFIFKGYDNFIIQNKINNSLLTKLDMSQFMTVDTSLAMQPGMVKKIHKYSGSGEAEILDRGEGNTAFVDADFVEEEYRVERTQAQARYYDDDAMADPVLVDKKIAQASDAMVNIWTKQAIAEFGKTEKISVFTDWKLANWADAIAIYANKYESQEGLFCLAAMDLVPTIRKALGEQLMYVEDYIRTGAIGAVLGVPIYTSKAVPEGTMFLATKEAVTAFLKKNVAVEQEHDVDTKLNKIVATLYSIIALTDGNKCIMCGKAQATPVSVTTKAAAAKVVAGAATNGAKVTVYVNGKKYANTIEASSNAYSVTGEANLVAGDKIHVVAELDGYVKSIVDAVV